MGCYENRGIAKKVLIPKLKLVLEKGLRRQLIGIKMGGE